MAGAAGRASVAAALLCLAFAAAAEDPAWDDWDDQPVSPWSAYIEFGHSARFSTDPAFDQRATRSELKAQIEVAVERERVQLAGKLDIHADAVADGLWFDLREATATLPLGARSQLKLGRQVLSWGTGDLLFINDRFPKDFVTPLAGGEDLYFKAPSNSARLALNLGAIHIDLAYTPRFTADRYIDGERLGFYDFRSGRRRGGADLVDARLPAATLANGEWALRMHRSEGGVEYAAYLYRGFDKQPLGANTLGQPSHFRRDSAGLSVRAPVAGGIGSIELGRELTGADPLHAVAWVPSKNSAILAYERELRPKLTTGLQWYGERHGSSVANASALNGQSRQVLSLRITRQALRDRLNLSAIGFYSLNQHDHWLRATLSYRYSDHWLAGASINAFGGRVDRFFGQLEDDSNAGIWVRWQL